MRRLVIVIAGTLLSAPAFAQAPVLNMYQSGAAGSASVPVSPTSGLPVIVTGTTPGARTIVPLDVATVTTGGTAVTALTAGHRTAGGWISNPVTATVNLGINEIGTAAGTTSAGNTTFITPGQTYSLLPSAGAVSVISSDAAHAFSGMGWQ